MRSGAPRPHSQVGPSRYLALVALACVAGGLVWYEAQLSSLSAESLRMPAPVVLVEEPEGPELAPPPTCANGFLPPRQVPIETASVVSDDACNELRVALARAKAERDAAQVCVRELVDEVARLELELRRAKFPEDTPYGAFLLTAEAEDITDEYALERIEDWLNQFPVFLRPGEATWIAERTLRDDWGLYGRTSERALIQFLGSARLIAELPAERLAELRQEYAEDGLLD